MANDLEVSLLSAILRSRDAALEAVAELDPDALSGEARRIFDLASEAIEVGQRPDYETVKVHLDARGELTEQTKRVLDEARSMRVTPMNVGSFIEELNSLYAEEKVKDICDEVYTLIRSGDVQGREALDLLEQKAFGIEAGQSGGFRSMSEITDSALQEAEEALESEGGVVGVPSGLDRLDDILGGFQDRKLYLIAARPSQGKSSLAGTCIFNSAQEGYANAGFLLEMEAEGFVRREIGRSARVNSFDISTGRLDDEEAHRMRRATESLSDLPIWLDDTPGLSVEQIYRKTRRLKSKREVDIVWVDYLQLMKESGGTDNRNQAVGHMSRTLKLMAKELDIPVVALSQLNRGVEHRGGKPIPKLSDIRESGNVEQDSDVVTFIYRPEEYGITRDEAGNDLRGIAKLLVKKHRGGSTGTAVVKFHDDYATFEDLAHSWHN